MLILASRFRAIRAELLNAWDWRVEAQLKFELIDLKRKISRLLSRKSRPVLTDV